MFQRFSCAITLSALLGIFVTTSANADFIVVNNSAETIDTHVFFTFIATDGFVYQRQAVTLGPGEKHVFDTGDMDRTKTVYLFVKSRANGKWNFTNRKWEFLCKHYELRQGLAPYWPQPFDSQGNKFVATEASLGSFDAVRNLMQGSKMAPALQIKPLQVHTNGFEFTYLGYTTQFKTRIWQ